MSSCLRNTCRKKSYDFLDKPISGKLFLAVFCRQLTQFPFDSIPHFNFQHIQVWDQDPGTNASRNQEGGKCRSHLCDISFTSSGKMVKGLLPKLLQKHPTFTAPWIFSVRTGPVLLRGQCSPTLTWTPSCKTASSGAIWPAASSEVPHSVCSLLMGSYSTQLKPSKQHAFEHTQ